MAGFHLSDAFGFEQWVVVERERLHFSALQGYRRLADHALSVGDYATGVRVAGAWLGLAPGDEEAHGQMMRCLTLNGQRSAALAQYESCRKFLRADLDVEPSDELQSLHHQIRAEALAAPAILPDDRSAASWSQPRAAHSLPQRLSSFMGREGEIAAIHTLFSAPTTRLVTIVGEGGVGKSSLAVAAGQELLDNWADGVRYASLLEIEADPVTALPHRLATALAEAVGLTFSTDRGAGDPRGQLFNFLSTRSLLLILDHFEHLSPGAVFVADLMRAAPGCRILVTSRLPLRVQAESVLRLDGLPVPAAAAPLSLPDESYASVALFTQRAKQRQHTFSITPINREALGRLCRLVAGNALALELAATWVEHFSVPEMVALLEADMLDFLRSPQQDTPQRHSSLRRVMKTSWQLLSADAQRVLAQLAIFRGSFHRKAALAVIDGAVAGGAVTNDGTLDLLVDLVNCSLLQQRGPGRYELHEVVRQFAAERLQEAAQGNEQSAQRHARYYLALVGRVERTPALIPQVTEELANVRQAWAWAVGSGDVAGLTTGSAGLWNFYLHKGLFQEAEEAFGRGIAALLASRPGIKDRRKTLAALQVAKAAVLNICSRYAEAMAVAEEAMSYALQEENEAIIARGYLQWGTAHYRQGEYDEAEKQLKLGLMAAQDAGLSADEADILRVLGAVGLEQGEFSQACARCQEALTIYRRMGNRLGEGNTLTDLGWFNQRHQNFTQARDYLQAALAIHTAIDNRHGAIMSLINLGSVQQALGDYSQAYAAYQQLLRDLAEQPDRYQYSLVNQSFGLLLSRLGDYPAARRHLMAALEIDRASGDRGGQAWAHNALGLLHNHLGDYKTGLAYHNEALRIGQEQGARTLEGLALLGMGQDLQGLGQWEAARAAFEKATTIQTELKQSAWVVESRSCLARTLLALEQPDVALALVEQILLFLPTQSLHGTREPAQIYWNCYTVLRARNDIRAPALLAEALDLVQSQATRIHDERLRHSYLHRVPTHREILHEAEMRLGG